MEREAAHLPTGARPFFGRQAQGSARAGGTARGRSLESAHCSAGELGVRILLAEDMPSTRAAMQAVMEAAGHEVVGVKDGAEAILHLEQQTFDVAVLDIWMPLQSGLDVLKQLRGRGETLPVILVSGGGPGASLEQAVTLGDLHGANAILFKPVDNAELLATLQKAVAD